MPESWSLSSTLSAVAAGAAAIAGFLTWRVARDKLKLDLYERRFAIYEAALDFYFLKDGQFDSSDPKKAEEITRNFTKAFREARFLFDTSSGVFEALDRVGAMADSSQLDLMTDLEAAMVKFIYFGKRRSALDKLLGLFVETGNEREAGGPDPGKMTRAT